MKTPRFLVAAGLSLALALTLTLLNCSTDIPEWQPLGAGISSFSSSSLDDGSSSSIPWSPSSSSIYDLFSSSSEISSGGSSSSVSSSSVDEVGVSSSSVGSSSSSSIYEPSSSSSGVSSGDSSSSVSSSSVGSSSSKALCLASEFEDTRDGNCYKYETAPNGRVWMSENLNYSGGGTLGWCYKTGAEQPVLGIAGENGPGYDRPYGRVYTWEAAINACPEGWHLPSMNEWSTISGSGKMSSSFYVISGNFNNNTEFPPLGWKERCSTGTCTGFYWASQNALSYMMLSKSVVVNSLATPPDVAYFSARCIKEESVSLPSSSSSTSSNSSGGGSCEYQPSMCGGILFAEVKTNATQVASGGGYGSPGTCTFTTGFIAAGEMFHHGPAKINGIEVTPGGSASTPVATLNSMSKIDGGYYIYLAADGGWFGSVGNGDVIVSSSPNCVK